MIVFPGQRDHRRSDINTVALVEMATEGLREPAYTAAEVQGPAPSERKGKGIYLPQDAVDLFFAAGKELVLFPFAVAFLRLGENGPERIGLSEGIPVPLHFLEFHVHAPSPENLAL